MHWQRTLRPSSSTYPRCKQLPTLAVRTLGTTLSPGEPGWAGLSALALLWCPICRSAPSEGGLEQREHLSHCWVRLQGRAWGSSHGQATLMLRTNLRAGPWPPASREEAARTWSSTLLKPTSVCGPPRILPHTGLPSLPHTPLHKQQKFHMLSSRPRAHFITGSPFPAPPPGLTGGSGPLESKEGLGESWFLPA